MLHSWEMLVKILQSERARDIVCDIGMPVVHKNSSYNCRVIIYNGKIALIRPKMWMANDGNYVCDGRLADITTKADASSGSFATSRPGTSIARSSSTLFQASSARLRVR